MGCGGPGQAERPLEIFGVEPAAHGEDGGGCVVDVRFQAAGLPEFVVGGVFQVGGPVGVLEAEVLFVAIRKRAEAEVVGVVVGGAELEAGVALGGRALRLLVLVEEAVEAEIGGEHEGAVVERVVAAEKVDHGCLGRGGDQRGMRSGNGRGGVEARVGNSENARFAVVALHVLQEPLDSVISVGAFAQRAAVRPHLKEDAFALVAAPHVLAHEDVAGLDKLFAGPQTLRVVLNAVRRAAIRSSLHQERIGAGGILGHINCCVEALAVPHRNFEFVLGICLAKWG